jgi:ubiquitin-protein ligase
VLLEVFAVFVTISQKGVPLNTAYKFLGRTLSNLVRSLPGPEPPMTRAFDEMIGHVYVWNPDTGGPRWRFDDVPAAAAASGGPFDAVPEAAAAARTVMTVVRTEKERSVLALAKGADGRRIVYSTLKGTLEWEKEAAPGQVSQATAVLIDDSGSMRSVAEPVGRRKSAVAREIAAALFEALECYRPPAVYACAAFSAAGEIAFATGRPVVPDAGAAGQTALWSAVKAVIEVFQSNRELASKATLRICVVTDGEDVTGERPLAVSAVFGERIVLDAIVLPSTDGAPPADLVAMAAAAGGVALCPRTFEEALALVRKEEFADLRCRGRANTVGVRTFRAAKKWVSYTVSIPKVEFYRQSEQLKTIEKVNADIPSERSYGQARMLTEIEIVRDEGFPVYGIGNSVSAWHVFVPGPLPGTNNKKVFWDLLIVFPPDYPYVAPVYRFLSVPPLKNVSPFGRIRAKATEYYHPRMHIATVVKEIQKLFWEVDPLVPATIETAADKPAFDAAQYEELIAKKVIDPWLPLPDMEYLAIAYGDILCDGAALPLRKKKPDLSPHVYSQLSWKKIIGEPLNWQGVIIAQYEERFFQRS